MGQMDLFGFKRRRRERLLAQRAPESWLNIVARNVPHYARLPREDQVELLDLMKVLLAEKVFEGCGGLEITDEIRVTVAAHAGILLLHRETDYYPRLDTILVYPYSFVVETRTVDSGSFVLEGEEVHSGEAWARGVVILAWDEVRHGIRWPRDGFNLVFHEFAHQLDMENGEADGFPVIEDARLAQDLGEVFEAEYDQLQDDVEAGRETLIDDYAAESPAEFFACVTELFFERPRAMKRRHPDLYKVLSEYYQQDPGSWGRPNAEEESFDAEGDDVAP